MKVSQADEAKACSLREHKEGSKGKLTHKPRFKPRRHFSKPQKQTCTQYKRKMNHWFSVCRKRQGKKVNALQDMQEEGHNESSAS